MDLVWRVAPFFGLIAAGAALGRLGILTSWIGGWLASYTYWLGFPVLLIHWLWSPAVDATGLIQPLLLYASVMLSVLICATGISRLRRWPQDASSGGAMTSAVGNTTYLGGPLAVASLGEAARPFAAALMAADCVVLTGVAVAMLQRARHGGESFRHSLLALCNPTILGAGTGLALWIAGAPRPALIGVPLSWVAAFTGPLALLALGGVMGRSRLTPTRPERAQLGVILTLKLLAAPALAWIVFTALGWDGTPRSVAVIMAGCPTALNAFVQARAAGVYERGAAMAVIFGTGASALTLTMLIAWMA